MNYSPKFNYIFIKLINKICNQNTPLNTSFNWFNKYKVTLQSGTNDFVSVYVENPNINHLPKCIASFSINFLTKELVIEQTYAENNTDFIIADSLIKAFKNVYSNTQTTINDYNIWEEYYKECMEIIHMKPSYVVDLVRKKKQIRTDNKYFDSIINKVIRKIIFLNGKNEFISEAIVMNLLNNEISQLKESIDKIAKANCSIKNYSKVIFNKTNIFLPLINTLTEQITKAPTNLVTEENVIKSNLKFKFYIIYHDIWNPLFCNLLCMAEQKRQVCYNGKVIAEIKKRKG